MTGFYYREGKCLLRGTDWAFRYNSTFCPHSVFVCFVWIWEQTAIISLYSIKWLVFITERESVYCAVRTGYLNIILRSAHTVYLLCVLCGSQNKQRLFPYTALNDWFLLPRGSVYCAVRTGYLKYNSTFCPRCIYVFCVDLRTNSDYFPIQY